MVLLLLAAVAIVTFVASEGDNTFEHHPAERSTVADVAHGVTVVLLRHVFGLRQDVRRDEPPARVCQRSAPTSEPRDFPRRKKISPGLVTSQFMPRRVCSQILLLAAAWALPWTECPGPLVNARL